MRVERVTTADFERVRKITWKSDTFALDPHYLLMMAQDRRWNTELWMLTVDEVPAVILAAMEPRFGSQAVAPGLDLNELFGESSPSARYLFLGNPGDIASGVSVNVALQDRLLRQAASVLVSTVIRDAQARSLQSIALYARGMDAEMIVEAMGAGAREASLGEHYTLDVAAGSLAEHLALQRASVRQLLRRDMRGIELAGLVSSTEDATSIIKESASLVGAVKANHEIVEHPRLVAFRLERWARVFGANSLAFAVRDADSALVAVTFAVRQGSYLELYEIGLLRAHPQRLLAYLEAMIHAPLRFALELGIRRIGLGSESPSPKILRGASSIALLGYRSSLEPTEH